MARNRHRWREQIFFGPKETKTSRQDLIRAWLPELECLIPCKNGGKSVIVSDCAGFDNIDLDADIVPHHETGEVFSS
jgi:hypothetical protein